MYSSNSETRKDNDKKIFCGGISYETTQQDIENYFADFGPVAKVSVKTDKLTQRSRGFAFVTFEDKETVQKVIEQKTHIIGDRKIEPKAAIGPEPLLKVFVGGMDNATTKEDLTELFEQFGTITDVHIAKDKATGKPRGFAFITYEEEEMADRASENPKQELCGRRVDVKKALPQNESNQKGGRYNNGGYNDFHGGNYGGYNGYGGQSRYNDGYYAQDYGYGAGGYDQSYDYDYSYNQGGYAGNYGGSSRERSGGNFGYHPYSSY